MPQYTVTNGSSQTLEADGITIRPGDTHIFTSACQLTRFSTRIGDVGLLEGAEGAVVDAVNQQAALEGCSERISGILVRPTPDGEIAERQADLEEDADQLGAPKTDEEQVQVDVKHGPYGEQGETRTPAEALHDPQAQIHEGEVLDGLQEQGLTEEEAVSEVERGLRGDPLVGEERSAHTGEKTQEEAKVGDPVQLMSGKLTLCVVDLDVPSPFFPLQFIRYYVSGFPYYGPLGYNWDHNWNIYLRPLNNGDIARGNGQLHEDVFSLDGSTYEPPRGVFEQLERATGTGERYIVRSAGGRQAVFERPPDWNDPERIPLMYIADQHGNKMSLQYNAANQLTQISDQDGRALKLFYDECQFIIAAEDHTGRRVQYGYDYDHNHLVAVCEPAVKDYPDGLVTRYEYDYRSPFRVMQHNILRIIDHDENTTLMNEYGNDPSYANFNKVVRQWMGDFYYQFRYKQLQWVPQSEHFVDIAATRTTVVHPNGAVWVYTFNYRGDLLDERFRLNADRSYRVVVTKRRFDREGNLVELIRPDGSSTLWTWDDNHADPRHRSLLLRVEQRPGFFVPMPSRVLMDIRYEPNFQQPITIRYENGAVERRSYDVRGNVTQIEWPEATLPDGTLQPAVTTFETNAKGQLTSIVSPEGIRQEYDYEPTGSAHAGLLQAVRSDVHGELRVTQYGYDALGYLATVTGENGNVQRVKYDARGFIEERILPEVSGVTDSIRYYYNAQGFVRKIERPRGEYTDSVITGDWIADEYEVDAIGRMRKIKIGTNTASPRVWKLETDYEGRPCRIEDPTGSVTTRCWDERGNLLSETVAAGTTSAETTRWVYDPTGRVTHVYEPGSDPYKQTYDPFGRVLEMAYPNGSIGRNVWGAMDLLVEEQLEGDPGDGGARRILHASCYQYDERLRLTHYTLQSFETDLALATPLTMQKWYDADGRCVRRTSPTGSEWHYTYNGHNELVRKQDPSGNVDETRFDENGYPIKQIQTKNNSASPLIQTTTFEHDARGRLVRQLHSSGAEYVKMYDGRDLPVRSIDASGVEARRTFGLLGEMATFEVDPAGLALTYTHTSDLLGRHVTFTDPTGNETTVERDPLGRITKVLLADGSTFSKVYNQMGLLSKEEHPDGAAIHYKYDSARRLVRFEATASDHREAVAPHLLTYDGLNRVIKSESAGRAAKRRYDSLDRLVLDSCQGRAFTAEYDDAAMEMLLQYPDGRTECHEWDSLGRAYRVSLVQQGALHSAQMKVPGLLHELSFSGTNHIIGEAFGSEAFSTWKHDEASRLMQVDHQDRADQLLESVRYRHDLYNRRKVTQYVGTPQANHAYQYDNRGRLVDWRSQFPLSPLPEQHEQSAQTAAILATQAAAAQASYVRQWSLNGADSRTQETFVEAGSTTERHYVLGAGEQLQSVDGQLYTYDANGARTADSVRDIRYDALGRMVELINRADPARSVSLSYDPFGRLSQLSTEAEQLNRFYFYDRMLHEENAAEETLRQFTYQQGLIVPTAMIDETGTYYLHYDASHSLVLATDIHGRPIERYRYTAFGEPTIWSGDGRATRQQSSIRMQPIFHGMTFMTETELYVTSFRGYDPVTGQFVSRDPYLHAQSPNPYVYAAHDPINAIDPDGDIAPILVAGLIFGGVGALIGAGSVLLSDGEADGWDVAAGATIGFGAGFIGAVTFGWAASAAGGALLTATSGTALAGSAGASTAISVSSGIIGGGVSGLASGAFSGVSSGVYHGGIRGRGDMWEMAWEGAYREGISGMAAGAVGGGIFSGALRTGTIPQNVSWASVRRTMAGGQPVQMIARGMMSPYGLGSAGAGFSSGMTSGVTRNLLEGSDFEDAIASSWSEGLIGAGAGLLQTGAHPTTYQYWRVRFQTNTAKQVQTTRPGRVHHQRSVARYPEYAVRNHTRGNPHDWLDRLNNAVTRGNIEGSQSTYNAPANPLTHTQMHNQWRFGQRGSWSQVATHGPWTPPWNHNVTAPQPSSESQSIKD